MGPDTTTRDSSKASKPSLSRRLAAVASAVLRKTPSEGRTTRTSMSPMKRGLRKSRRK